MKFEELLLRAKENDIYSLEKITEIYKPLLIKESIVNGVFDSNLYQELYYIFINCVFNTGSENMNRVFKGR